jgi:hypothetical protein
MEKFSAKVFLLADSIVITNMNQTAANEIPTEFQIFQNYPNPFNPTTAINYHLPNEEHIVIKVYDILGKEVTTLIDEVKQAGNYTVYFDGQKLASGVYIYRASYNSQNITRKMLLLK